MKSSLEFLSFNSKFHFSTLKFPIRVSKVGGTPGPTLLAKLIACYKINSQKVILRCTITNTVITSAF